MVVSVQPTGLSGTIEQLRTTLRHLHAPLKLSASPWISAAAVVQKQRQHPDLTQPQALSALFEEVLTELGVAYPAYADLLRGRFWQGLTVTEMVTRTRPEAQSERRFHQQQELALEHFALLLEQRERHCQQQPHGQQTRHQLLHQLPIPTYDELFGIDSLVNQLCHYLDEPHRHPILSLKGIGGIGKTALADFVVRQHLTTNAPWQDLIWISAKQEYLTKLGIHGVQTHIRVDQILDELGQKLHLSEVLRLPLAQKIDRLATVLRAAPYLVVLDNLESVEDFRQLAPLLARLARPTQFILTTRATVPALTTITEVDLDELDEPAAQRLILHMAQKKNVHNCDPAAIYSLVGGNPLAIILVVSQLQFWPAARVLERVEKGVADNMYTYIYWQAWCMLDKAAQALLFVIQRAGDQADWSWLVMASDLTPAELDRALRQLYDLSLIQLQRDDKGEPSYAIHRLTATFLRTEVLGWK